MGAGASRDGAGGEIMNEQTYYIVLAILCTRGYLLPVALVVFLVRTFG